jgi:glycosyltransferase involved in cell wall biosynthesis
MEKLSSVDCEGGSMGERRLRILMVNSEDAGGGAAKVAMDLLDGYHAREHDALLAVGSRRGDHPRVVRIPNDSAKALPVRTILNAAKQLESVNRRVPGTWRLAKSLEWLAEPVRRWEARRGVEDFRFPGTSKLFDLVGGKPDLLHGHNLHGGYFDLRQLPWLSAAAPTVLTLHDAWLFSGHCAHSLDCTRWKHGCGACPYLQIDPPIQQDSTAYNWERKREVLARSRVYVASPSRWLLEQFRQSILAPAVIEARVIPNGVDLSVYRPEDQAKVRGQLGLERDAVVLLIAGRGIRRSIWKDFSTLRAAIERAGQALSDRRVVCVVLGDAMPEQNIGSVRVRSVEFLADPRAVASYYQAADVYMHAAKADTFPNVVLEALACGTPVVGTAVGGIPEQIIEGQTGHLVPATDAAAMAERVVHLVKHPELRQRMSRRAAEDAANRFDVNQQVGRYTEWFERIVWDRSIDKAAA